MPGGYPPAFSDVIIENLKNPYGYPSAFFDVILGNLKMPGGYPPGKSSTPFYYTILHVI